MKENLIFPEHSKYGRSSTIDFERFQDFVVAVRSLRKNLLIPPQDKIKVYVDDEDNFLNRNIQFLKKLAGIDEILSTTNPRVRLLLMSANSIKFL